MVILSTNAYQNQKMVDDEPAGGCATTYSFILCGVEGDSRWSLDSKCLFYEKM